MAPVWAPKRLERNKYGLQNETKRARIAKTCAFENMRFWKTWDPKRDPRQPRRLPRQTVTVGKVPPSYIYIYIYKYRFPQTALVLEEFVLSV